jgi:peptidoglycan/LPS O-acetylase OafA/YrhL
MQQVHDFTIVDEAAATVDRELATEVLAAHVEYERRRRSRIHLVHVVAVLSGPVGLQVAFPELLSPSTGRSWFALWLGVAVWALSTAVAEWKAGRAQVRRLGSFRGRLGASERRTAG